MFSLVLVVRLVFLVGERKLLVYTVTYCRRHILPVTQSSKAGRGHALVMAGDEPAGGEGGPSEGITFDFKKVVVGYWAGDRAVLTHVLIVSILVQVVFWFADFKFAIAYDPTLLAGNKDFCVGFYINVVFKLV
jgi:hypothetical protein